MADQVILSTAEGGQPNASQFIGIVQTLLQLARGQQAIITALNSMSDGNLSGLNITAATVVKASAGRLVRVLVVAQGSGGALTLNDCATTGAAAAANQIITIPYNATGYVVGATFTLNWPCALGIVVSAVPSGGGQVSISYA